jgi:hypothetical protein
VGLQIAPKNTEEVEAIFKEEAASLNKIIVTNKLKIKKEDDLIKCIQLYNQLTIK